MEKNDIYIYVYIYIYIYVDICREREREPSKSNETGWALWAMGERGMSGLD